MDFLPYHISHINLQENLQQPDLSNSAGGNYLVFWWGDISIGHLFLKPRQQPNSQQYWQMVAKAIAPAVQKYAKRSTQPPSSAANAETDSPTKDEAPWQEWLIREQQELLWAYFNTIFAPFAAPAMPETVPVSLVICTRNRAATLRECLLSLRKLRCQPQEIVIIDNAPSDNSTREVVQEFPEAVYFVEPNPGLSFARNTGLQKATQPLIAFTDDDVVVHHNWIYRVWQAFEDPQTAAITGLVIATELKSETQLIFEQHWSFNRGFVDITYDQQFFRKTLSIGPPVWEIGAGANMAFRKSVFSEVGLFDERLGAGASGCSEDSEMWYRILAKGYTIRYTPRAVVFHEHRSSLEALHKQLYSYMKGFAVAALIQQEQLGEARYKRHLFVNLPKYYLSLLRRGFPFYRFRYRTVATEIKGVCAGLLFYLQHRHTPAQRKELGK